MSFRLYPFLERFFPDFRNQTGPLVVYVEEKAENILTGKNIITEREKKK
jgi:hypothetical protein